MEQKHSRKRDAILACIKHTTSHPTAEWVYTQLKPSIPDLSLGTVYRNLNAFRTDGTIISVGTVNGNERYDGNTCPHGHFACERCNSVLDLGEILLPPLPEACAQVNGYNLMVTGVCKSCADK